MAQDIKVSIAIPCYEMHGKGGEFLDSSLNIISNQTYKNIEVVISDHSTTDLIKNVVDKWNTKMDIKYVRSTYKVGSSSANVNTAMNNCSGVLIKPLFQDDFLSSNKSIELTVNAFDLDKNWLVSACIHTNDGVNRFNPHYPRWNEHIHRGINTISSPSVITIKKDVDLRFDENFIWLMDVEYYKRLYIKYGPPIFLNDITIVNRLWEKQLTNTITMDRKNEEVNKLIRQYEAS